MKTPSLAYLQIAPSKVKYQLNVTELIQEAIQNGEGSLTDTGALAIDTGKFTGRSPKDRFIVCDALTQDTVWWGDVNIKFSPDKFEALQQKLIAHLNQKPQIYVRDAYAVASPKHQIAIRVISETAYQNLFSHHLFIRPQADENIENTDWTIIAAKTFEAQPELDGTRQGNFSIINFTKKTILIGGTGYTGEIKKGIFSVLNFILPHDKNVLSMHCSANVGKANDTAIFFGLSGTGKTTLSADADRYLIGDDEHGWDGEEVFNIEGGCYAKCVDLTEEKEPQIFRAIKKGALVENTNYFAGTHTVDFTNIDKTENTRVAYPIDYIDNAKIPSMAPAPKNIFFLTADACGVLPPIAKLTVEQAMYHFISGYTAKVAGTEAGIIEPQKTFSACFGKAFLPLHPFKYSELLGKKLAQTEVNVWLINTGWTGGAYGVGQRISLKYTRAMIAAALEGKLAHEEFVQEPYFGLQIPKKCENVPSELLNPQNTWADKEDYVLKAKELVKSFAENMKQFQ